MNNKINSSKNKIAKAIDTSESDQGLTREYTKSGGSDALSNDFDRLPGRAFKFQNGTEIKTLPDGKRAIKRLATPLLAGTLEMLPPLVELEIDVRTRTKSSAGKDTYFEAWQTPLTEGENIWLSYMLLGRTNIYFFFKLYSDKFEKINVMTISRYCPFRLTEECQAEGYLTKYFNTDEKNPKLIYKNSKGVPIATWKIWGTQYIKEIDSNFALSDYKEKHNPNIFQYFIRTQEEWIEFISSTPPDWAEFENKKINELIAEYIKAES
ncbi:MAG: hypothetical protein ABL927_10305 [Bdellovibrionales bacterium]